MFPDKLNVAPDALWTRCACILSTGWAMIVGANPGLSLNLVKYIQEKGESRQVNSHTAIFVQRLAPTIFIILYLLVRDRLQEENRIEIIADNSTNV
jgi:hypothetical protein